MIRTMFALAFALAPATALAQSKSQFRELQLVDGRSVTVEVLSTEATGLLMRTPQGTSLVSFELLRDMVPTDAAAYDAQPDWTVHVAGPDEVRGELIAALRTIPSLEVLPVGEAGGGVSASQASAAARCELDVDCVAGALSDSSWRWVVVALPTSEGLRVVSALNSGPTRNRVDLPTVDADQLWTAAHTVLALQVPEGGPPRVAKAPGLTTSFDQQRVVAMSFTPVPGLPSLRQGDPGGFAAALGIVVPTTALWVGAVGQNAQSVPETVALGAVGFYAATVLANQVTGMNSMRKARRRQR